MIPMLQFISDNYKDWTSCGYVSWSLSLSFFSFHYHLILFPSTSGNVWLNVVHCVGTIIMIHLVSGWENLLLLLTSICVGADHLHTIIAWVKFMYALGLWKLNLIIIHSYFWRTASFSRVLMRNPLLGGP